MHALENGNSSNLKDVTDVLEILRPSDLIGIVVSDLELYRKLHEFIHHSKNMQKEQENKVLGDESDFGRYMLNIKSIF